MSGATLPTDFPSSSLAALTLAIVSVCTQLFYSHYFRSSQINTYKHILSHSYTHLQTYTTNNNAYRAKQLTYRRQRA